MGENSGVQTAIIQCNQCCRSSHFNFSAYADGDLRVDDVCIGVPYDNKVFGRTKSVHGGPLICLNDQGAPVLSGIASRNSKSMNRDLPGVFSNIFVLRKVLNYFNCEG